MKHLTEEEIQASLDGSSERDQKSLAAHLYICPECRRLYEEYQKLYLGLAKTDIPELSPAFADRVMSEIETADPEKQKTSVWIPIFALANIAAGIAAVIYFVDLSFLSGLLSVFGGEEEQIQMIIGKLTDYVSMIGFDIDIVLTVGLAIILISAVDLILRSAKKKPATFVV